MNRTGLSAAVIYTALLSTVTAQATWHVQAGAAPPGNGSAASPFPTIQAGIDAASNGDLVLVGPGTFLENIDFLGKAIEVSGAQGSGTTIIDAQQAGLGVRFMTGESRDSVLRGLTVQNGRGMFPSSQTGGGGNIGCLGASPSIIDCVLQDGDGSNGGGGIFCGGGGPLISGCAILGNWGYHLGGGIKARNAMGLLVSSCTFLGNGATCSGGGISVSGSARIEDCMFRYHFVEDCGGGSLETGGFLNGPGDLDVVRCRFESSYGAFGGAVDVGSGSSARFFDCHFRENSTYTNGGAVYVESNGTGIFERCTFVGNSARSGGAIYGSATASNSVFAGNTALPNWFYGGGAFGGGSATFVNCTTVGNSGTAQGGAFAFQSQVQLTNCIHWNNLPPTLPPGFALAATSSDIQGGWPGPGNIDADPLFVDPLQGAFHLSAVSPCRNAGTAAVAGLSRWDFEGHPRHWESAPDMGADEFVARLAGTEDDLVLVTEIDGLWPLSGTQPALPGEVLDIGLYSPSGTFLGGVPYLAASLHPNGSPPAASPSHPQLWIDVNAFVILVDGPSAFPAGLSEAVIQLDAVLPPSLAGSTVRLQAAAFPPGALAGNVSLTDAHDIVIY